MIDTKKGEFILAVIMKYSCTARGNRSTRWREEEKRKHGGKGLLERERKKKKVKPHLRAYRYENYLRCTPDMKLQH